MKKLVLTSLAAVVMLLTVAGNAQAQRVSGATRTSSPTQLRLIPEESSPLGSGSGSGSGTWTVGQLSIYPNPITGGYCYLQVNSSGVMVLDAIPLSGPFMGSQLPFAIDKNYVANSRKVVTLPSYLYSAEYLISGRVGTTFIQQRVKIIR